MKFYPVNAKNLETQEDVRGAYGDTLVNLGEKFNNVVVLDADLSESTKTIKFKEKFSKKFFDVGVAEQNLMDVAAGLSMSGKIVFASTFAYFGSGRAWDQIRNIIAHDKLNVRIVVTHSGLGVGEDGHSHQALEDIALMRVIPCLKVIVPADATETKKVIEKSVEIDRAMRGPMYVRLVRQNVPKIFDDDYEFELGNAVKLIDGSDVSIIACGVMVSKAIEASKILKNEGIKASVINMSSIKPIDENAILEEARRTNAIITAEDHSTTGGLGSAVAEILSEKKPTLMRRIGTNDCFGQSGNRDELYKYYGMTAKDIANAAKKILKK
ncbi:MAG: transketolase family protein [Candidatus Altarchaeum sp.]|nr:transketolase family protein [Candidatus Altarchaeum sp.]